MRVKDKKGITLIALVITIIILLILAGVAIATLTGENGILTKASTAKEKHIIEQYKEDINLSIAEEVAQRKTEKKEELMIISLDKKIREKEWVNEIYKCNGNGEEQPTFEESTHLLVESKEHYEFLIEVNEEKKTAKIVSNQKGTGEKYKITYNSNGADGEEETVEIRQGFAITLKKCNYTKENYQFAGWCENQDGDGEYYSEDSRYMPESDVTLYAIWEKEAPKYWVSIEETDNTWYSYKDISSGEKEVKVNAPKLTGRMKAIKYNGSDANTQNGSKWANATTSDGSMWVWIPRYAYKVTEGYHSSTAGTIEIAFINTKNEFLNDDTGEITTNPTDAGAGRTTWLVHPAFTSNAANGGGFGEIEGFWVGKFDTANTEEGLSVKPAQVGAINMIRNEQYKLAKSSKFGEKVDLKAHMAKNSEHGAVIYLAHSKYGTNKQKVAQNNDTSYYTGGSSNEETIYQTNQKQSTTYNATGVYDLNGCAVQNTASYVNYTGSSNLKNNGGIKEGDLYGETEEERATSTPYKTVYVGTGTASQNMGKTETMKGDAIFETVSSSASDTGAWFTSMSRFPNSDNPFFGRASMAGNSNASMFGLGCNSGIAKDYYSFSMILVL